MITGNVVAPISHSLKALVQRIREETRMKAEFGNERDAGRADQDVISSVEQTLNRADTELAALSIAEAEIAANGDLSSEGKTKKMIGAVARTYESLKSVRRDATQKRNAASEAERSLSAVPKIETDPTLDMLTSMEIRRVLRTMVQNDRMKLFTHAVRSKGTSIQRAIMNDPLFSVPSEILEPLVPQDYIDHRVIDEAAQSTQTKEYRRWETLSFAAESWKCSRARLKGLWASTVSQYHHLLGSLCGHPIWGK